MALARLVRAVRLLLLAALCVLAGPLPARRGALAAGPAWPLEAAGCLAFLREGDAWLACPAGDVRLTSHGRAASPRLAPGAQTLAYLLLPAAPAEAADVRLLSLASGVERSAGPAPAPWGAPAWAPDGAALAWLGGDALYLYDPAAGGPRPLATGLAFREAPRPAPSWRADGAALYLPGWEGDSRAVWAVSLAGERRTLATPTAHGPLALASAPSGDRLALADGAALSVLLATGEALGPPCPCRPARWTWPGPRRGSGWRSSWPTAAWRWPMWLATVRSARSAAPGALTRPCAWPGPMRTTWPPGPGRRRPPGRTRPSLSCRSRGPGRSRRSLPRAWPRPAPPPPASPPPRRSCRVPSGPTSGTATRARRVRATMPPPTRAPPRWPWPSSSPATACGCPSATCAPMWAAPARPTPPAAGRPRPLVRRQPPPR